MRSDAPVPEEDLLPFGAPQEESVDPSVRAKLAAASPGKKKPRRSRRALRPLWYSIPLLLIALVASAYLIGITLWSRSSLGHWSAQRYEVAQAGYDGQMKWTSIGIERWVAHYNLGTTLVRQESVDEGVAELRTAFDLVPKAVEVQPGRLEAFSYECRVRVNLAIGIEIQGDALNAAGSYADAAKTYQEAEDLISPCQSVSNGGQSGNQGQSGDNQQSGDQGQSGDNQQSGEQSDNPADKNKSRVEDKKQKAEEQSDGQDGSEGEAQDQQQDEGQQGKEASPSPSPTENPYAGESEEQKKRRENLQGQNESRAKDQREKRDDRRTGNPKGAW